MNIVCDIRPTKTEKFRVRLTIWEDVLEYLGDSSFPAISLLESKLIINSTISDATIDIKDYFLQSDLPEPEYLYIHSKYFFKDIGDKYIIDGLIATDEFVYCKMKKELYGLKQAARLAHDKLVKNLAKYGYEPCNRTQNIWKHKIRPIQFIICVDDFRVK